MQPQGELIDLSGTHSGPPRDSDGAISESLFADDAAAPPPFSAAGPALAPAPPPAFSSSGDPPPAFSSVPSLQHSSGDPLSPLSPQDLSPFTWAASPQSDVRPGAETLMAMGFSLDDSNTALDAARGSIAQAAHVLATRQAPAPAGGREGLAQLVELGFSEADANAALDANADDVASAADWLAQGYKATAPGTEAPSDPSPAQPAVAAGGRWPERDVAELVTLGFSEADAARALEACAGVVEQAADWLFEGNAAAAPAPAPAPATQPQPQPGALPKPAAQGDAFALFAPMAAATLGSPAARKRRTSVDEIHDLMAFLEMEPAPEPEPAPAAAAVPGGTAAARARVQPDDFDPR
eukprot:COSAG04_NODE_6321_length_1357_cov_0.793323_1_plen_353_part_00